MQPELKPAKPYFEGEAALRALLDHAGGKAAVDDILAIAHLCASVGSGEDRPVARRPVVVDAVRGPLRRGSARSDKARVGDPLAGIARVVDRPLEPDREIERVELVKLLLLVADDPDLRLVASAVAVVAGRERDAAPQERVGSASFLAPSARDNEFGRARLQPSRARPRPRRFRRGRARCPCAGS